MGLPSFLVPNAPGAEDIKCMDLRIDYIERLYRLDGRAEPEHPQHAVYTGLLEKYGNDKL